MSTSRRNTRKIYLLLAVFLAVPFLAEPTPLAADDKPIAIVHGTLIDGLGGPPVDDATLILRGATIKYAGPTRDAKIPPDARIIDAKGRTVMPGLADLHVHLQGAWDGTSVDLLGYQRYFNALLYAGVVSCAPRGASITASSFAGLVALPFRDTACN